MSSVGWKVLKQSKDYGPYITAEIDGDDLRVFVRDNPLGLTLPVDALQVPGSRDSADKICYVLSNLFEEVEAMQARVPTGQTPKPLLQEDIASSVLPPIELIRAHSALKD